MPDDPIKHVVVLLLENHSFDQMLGCFKDVYPGMEGVDPAKPGQNSDSTGTVFKQIPTTERQMVLDPHHEVEHVATQLADNNGGFVKDFVQSFNTSTNQQRQFVMGYFPRGFLPALHRLGETFTICDHWFSSLPGPTWPNRFFALTGTSNGRVNMPEDGQHGLDLAGWFQQDQPTIFDRLSEKGINWRVYFHDIPQSCVLMHQRRPENAARYYYIQRFFEDCRGVEEDFPLFSFIEPDYMGAEENDDHPPHDVMKAEKLIADVYNAIRANGDLWASTLLVVFYDEHGGFYDHVVPPGAVPPGAVPPDAHHEEYTFDRVGVRVPAILVSPWTRPGVNATQFDHTSVLKYLTDKWGLGPLGERTRTATSIAVALNTNGRPRLDVLPHIELTADELSPPNPDLEEEAQAKKSVYQESLALLARYIRIEAVEGLPRLWTWAARVFEGIKSVCEWLLQWVHSWKPPLEVSLTQPDRVSRVKVKPRDDVARFLHHQKLKAVTVLAQTIRDPQKSATQKDHAVRALGSMTGRKFHRENEHVAKADTWLRRHGH